MAETDVGRLEQDVSDIKAGVDRLAERIEARFDAMEQRLARLEGGFEQMSQRMGDLGARMSSVEALQRWGVGLYAVLILAVLGLYFKGTL